MNTRAWRERPVSCVQRGSERGRRTPRRSRKALPTFASALGNSSSGAERYCQLAARNTRRIALVLAGDLQAALQHVLGTMPSRETAQGSEDALDLIEAWTSSHMVELRRKLGMAL